MRRLRNSIPLAIIFLLFILVPPNPVSSQVGPLALVGCREMAFSVEQDFPTWGPEPPDGDPIISDGDLLGLVQITGGFQGFVCARNADLLQGFDVNEDIGLDAVDVIDVDSYIVAFSTELNSPNLGQFTAGDLLVTNDAIIPNKALVYTYDPTIHDLGLDALHFVGEKEDILDFLASARLISRSTWLTDPGTLANELDAYGIDIWFSTEGTTTGLLDGDLLSAKSGLIVVSNDALLPASVPAGIPVRGIDYGLDAITSDRSFTDAAIHFSTELIFTGDPTFIDGDILQLGNGVILTLFEMVEVFEPPASSLGLDALFIDINGGPELEYLFLPLIMR
jgi:hypothetical protein